MNIYTLVGLIIFVVGMVLWLAPQWKNESLGVILWVIGFFILFYSTRVWKYTQHVWVHKPK